MDKQILLDDLDASTENLIKTVAQFDDHNFNYKPSDEEWSAAQVAEHLLILEITANKAISGETIPTNRAPDAKIALIKRAMEDGTKRTAPERVKPSNLITDPQAAIEKFKKQRSKLREAIINADLTEACVSFKHTALGTLTRWEWIYFNIYHLQRHLQQMKRLQSSEV